MTTLIVNKHAQVGNRQFQHGEELPPDLLPREVVDHWLDQRFLLELDSSDRRSLFRLFPHFSGCKEQEQLTNEERNNLCLNSQR
jgi:hypothetical protein